MGRNVNIHPLSDVEPGAEIGEGTTIWRWTHVMPTARIGKDVMIGQGCFIGSSVVIGNRCRLQNGVYVWTGVSLAQDVFVGPNATFTNVRWPRTSVEGGVERTAIERGATIGANATIRCGITIGEEAWVGAGAVVTHDVEPGTVVVGNPARRTDVQQIKITEVRVPRIDEDYGLKVSRVFDVVRSWPQGRRVRWTVNGDNGMPFGVRHGEAVEL